MSALVVVGGFAVVLVDDDVVLGPELFPVGCWAVMPGSVWGLYTRGGLLLFSVPVPVR